MVRFGGENGLDVRFAAGDVVVIPAGSQSPSSVISSLCLHCFDWLPALVVCVPTGIHILPLSGVAHKCIMQTDDFMCVGSYPTGQIVDMLLGKEGERPAADERIAQLALPEMDPVQGAGGILDKLWKKEATTSK